MMPLHCACWKGQTEAAEFLLSNGAQISEADTSLKTALHWTVQFGHFETLLTLLKVLSLLILTVGWIIALLNVSLMINPWNIACLLTELIVVPFHQSSNVVYQNKLWPD